MLICGLHDVLAYITMQGAVQAHAIFAPQALPLEDVATSLAIDLGAAALFGFLLRGDLQVCLCLHAALGWNVQVAPLATLAHTWINVLSSGRRCLSCVVALA